MRAIALALYVLALVLPLYHVLYQHEGMPTTAHTPHTRAFHVLRSTFFVSNNVASKPTRGVLNKRTSIPRREARMSLSLPYFWGGSPILEWCPGFVNVLYVVGVVVSRC